MGITKHEKIQEPIIDRISEIPQQNEDKILAYLNGGYVVGCESSEQWYNPKK